MNNVLLWIGGVLVVVLCALFAVPHFVNWNLYRGQFEEEASRLLARDVRVSGGVTVRFLPAPFIAFEKVRVGSALAPVGEPTAKVEKSAESGTGEPVLRVERFTMGLSLTDLARGRIAAHEVELVRPEVRVALGDQGAGLLALLASPNADRGAFAVDTLRIVDGSITLLTRERAEAFVVTQITGDLSQGGGAPKFRGLATFAGDARDVRISTSENGPGSLKVKSVVRTVGSTTSYAFDGAFSGLQGTLAYDGEITARLPVGTLSPGTDAPAAATNESFELKGRIAGNAAGLAADELALSFERDGKPQLIEGKARMGWAKGLEASATLGSRWLDLDRVFVSEGGARPAQVAGWLARVLAGTAPPGSRFAATLDVDSVTLGAEQLSDIRLAFGGGDGLVTLEKGSANVPGGRIEVTGRTTEDRKSFAGQVLVKAASARRLVGWLSLGTGLPQPRVDGPMFLDGRITAHGTAVELTDMLAEIGGQTVRGAAAYAWTTRPTFTLDIAAERLSVGSLLPKLVSAQSLLALASADHGTGGAARPSELARLIDPRSADLNLVARIGELDDGERRIFDLDVDLVATASDLQLNRLAFVTAAGTRAKVRGRVQSAASDPRGTLVADISADTTRAAEELLALVPATGGQRPAEMLASLTPVRLSGRLRLGEEAQRGDGIVVDGSLAGSRVYARATFDNGLSKWPREWAEVYAAVAGPETSGLVRLLGNSAAITDGLQPADADHVVIRLAGVPANGMRALAGLTLASSTGSFDGRVVLPLAGSWRANGRVGLAGTEARHVLAWAGGTGLRVPTGLPIEGTFELDQTEAQTSIKLFDVKLASVPLTGSITIPRAQGNAGAQAGFVADLKAGRLPANLLFEPFLIGSASRSADSGLLLPDVPFNLEALKSARGKLLLSATEFVIDDRLSLAGARLTANFGPAGIEVSEFTGAPLGGTLNARFTLKPDKVDASLVGSIRADGLALAGLGGGSTGTVGVEAAFAANGITPRSLLQLLSGSGQIKLADVVVAGVDTNVVAATVQRATTGDQLAEGEDISALVGDVLATGRLALNQGQVQLQISNGAVRIAEIRVDTPQASVVNRTTLDIVALKADLDWRITPTGRAAQSGARPLPGLGVVYAGPVTRLATLSPRILADDLQRELTVRRLERNVEELERLRRQDEERARLEAERRRKQEEEAQKAAEAAAAATAAAAAAANGNPSPAPAAATGPAPAPTPTASPTPAPGSAPAEPAPPAPQPAQRRQRPTSQSDVPPKGSPWETTTSPR